MKLCTCKGITVWKNVLIKNTENVTFGLQQCRKFHTHKKNWYQSHLSNVKITYGQFRLILGSKICAQISHVDNFWRVKNWLVTPVKNWCDFFSGVKNWYQFLTHVKNWYQFLTHVKNSLIISDVKRIDKYSSHLWPVFWGVKNWYQLLLHVWRLGTNSSYMWRIGTNSSYMWRIGTNTSYMWRIHENIATTNHPLPLIPVEQLSADGERIFTKY